MDYAAHVSHREFGNEMSSLSELAICVTEMKSRIFADPFPPFYRTSVRISGVYTLYIYVKRDERAHICERIHVGILIAKHFRNELARARRFSVINLTVVNVDN